MKTVSKILINLLACFFVCSSCSSGKNNQKELSDHEILSIIESHRPSKGAVLPDDFKNRIGATHVGGKYYFTDKPYIIEGCQKLYDMGYGVAKLWFYKDVGGYPYNSEWNLPKDITLKELASHPYYKACFDMDFKTFVLNVGGAGVNTTDETAIQEEQEIYELTKYLLEEYKNRDMEFVLANWEGDWIMRGGTGDNARWARKSGELIQAVDGDRRTVLVPSDSLQRIRSMQKWFTARQNGVAKARMENPYSKCKVYHAVEANKVLDSMNGIPGIVNYVLPGIKVDMVSWSCYDALSTTGLDDGLMLYKGISYIKEHMNPTEYMKGQKKVFLGEIGIPEQRYPGLMEEDKVVKNWDTYIAVCLAQDVPYLVHWELYCNEPKDEALRSSNEVRKTEDMRGFWLVRPDGTLSYAAKYFNGLLQ